MLPNFTRFSLNRLYFLIAATMGVYNIFWFHRQTRALIQDGKLGMRAWAWAVLSAIPAVDVFVIAFVGHRIYKVIGIKPWLEYIALLLVFVVSGYSVYLIDSVWVFLLSVAVYPVPLLLLQRRINLAMNEASPEAEADLRYTVRQAYALVVGIMVLVLFLLTEVEPITPPPVANKYGTGEYHDTGNRVQGDSGFYEILLPEGKWQTLPQGTIHEDTDIELRDDVTGIEAWVYIKTGKDADLEDQVSWRKNNMREDNTVVEFDEERSIYDDQTMAVHSLAHYEYKNETGKREYWWVRTLETDARLVEFLIWYRAPSNKTRALELAHALVPIPANTTQDK